MSRRTTTTLVAAWALLATLAPAPAQTPSSQSAAGQSAAGQSSLGQTAPKPPSEQPSGLRSNTLHQGELKLAPNDNVFKRPKRDSPLKGGEVVRGSVGIAAAWFSEPSNRYRHLPFGTDQHPGALTVSTKDRQVLKFQLPKDSVFEDRTPRLIDLDGDGREEIVVIRAYGLKGAALAVLKVREKLLEIVAETPPLGSPFQWLNPAGFADFDGDGQTDIALVVNPHSNGELQIWTLRGGALVMLAETDDVSNHAFGSPKLKLSAIADFNGDGVPDIAVPSRDRRTLRFLTLVRDRIEELGEVRLVAPATEDFEVVAVDGKPAVRVGLAGGRTTVVAPCRDVRDWEMADGSC